MATVSVVRYQRKGKIGDDRSPMVYVLKPEPGESRLYSIKSLACEIKSIGSLLVEDVERMMQSFIHSMRKVLVTGDKVKVGGLEISYATLTYPDVEQEKDCMVRNIIRINPRFKVDSSLRLANGSTVTTRGGDNSMVLELISRSAPASGGSGDGGGSSSGGDSGDGSGSGGDEGEEETPDPTI